MLSRQTTPLGLRTRLGATIMSIEVGVSVTGLPELVAKLDGLKEETQRKGGRFALRKAAQVIRDQAKVNARAIDDPNSPESIADNIVERFSPRRFKRTGDLMFRVGVMGGARPVSGDMALPGGNTTHWRMVELGTSSARAQPFMRPAGEQAAQQATDVFIREYNKAIDRALRKAAKTGSTA